MMRGPTTTDPLMTVPPNTGVKAATWTYSRPDKMLTERGARRGEASPPSAEDVVTPAPAPAAAAQRRSAQRREVQARRRLEAELEAAADKLPSPMELFEMFFTPEMQDRTVRCTKARAGMLGKLLKFAENPDLLEHVDPAFREALERPAWIKASQSWPPKSIGEWRDIDRDELKVWMGITYYRGLVKLPACKTKVVATRSSRASAGSWEGHGMSRRRYEMIYAMLSLQTREEDRRNARSGRMEVFAVDAGVRDEMSGGPVISGTLSLDEQTVGCKSKWTSLTFRTSTNPQDRVQIYSVNNMDTGYTMTFDLDAPDRDQQKS